MTTYDIALIGFGGVNRTLAELIATRGEALRSGLGFGLRVVAITDLRLGSLVQPEGIDLSMALGLGGGSETFAEHGGSADTNNESVIRTCTADIICEATFTNPDDGEPAVSHVRWALESGKSVCTTNKGPVALRGAELTSLAEQNGVHFEFEGAVMSGTPVIRLAKKMFAGLRLNGFEGILNGTSNYVLGRMEAGLDFEAAISEAQELGYAEANPAADIEGYDVQLKVLILANELLDAGIELKDVQRQGISTVTPERYPEGIPRRTPLEARRFGTAEPGRVRDSRRIPRRAPPRPRAGRRFRRDQRRVLRHRPSGRGNRLGTGSRPRGDRLRPAL